MIVKWDITVVNKEDNNRSNHVTQGKNRLVEIQVTVVVQF